MLRPGRQRVGVDAVLAAGMERPQQQQQIGGGGLEQRRDVDVEGAEAHAVFAQLGARRLVERLDLLGDRVAPEHAEVLGQPEGDAAGEAGEVLGFAQLDERLSLARKLGREPGVEARQHALALGGAEMLVGEELEPRLERGRRRARAGRSPMPAQTMRPFGVERDGIVAAPRQARRRERRARAASTFGRGVARGLAVDAVAAPRRA